MPTIRDILSDIRSPRKKKVIIDTDAYNEIDDQYAIAYALFSDDKLDVLSINAAPFENDNSTSFADGMEKSYDEIFRVLSLCKKEGVPVYEGSREPIEKTGTPKDSPAARNIIKTARESDEPVYILGLGAATNIASAIMLDREAMNNAVVIWLGGNSIEGDNLGEFNLVQDYTAGQILLDSGVALLLCPAWTVTCVLTSNLELTESLRGHGAMCDYLYEITIQRYLSAGSPNGWVRTIWDVAAPAILIKPECAEIQIIKAPVFTEQRVYGFDDSRHEILYLSKIERDIALLDALRVLKA